jgi:DNA (cytosine-5)-methyltransferase 1
MKYFSMFSGIGGFELGIKQAYEILCEQKGIREKQPIYREKGFSESDKENWINGENARPNCIGYSEIDKYASQVFDYHFPNTKNYGDCTKINAKELPDFDLLVGGFPCQSFSIAGKRMGFNDTRGTLFFDIARILKEKHPRNFILENVKGLLSHDNGRTFKTIITTLAELGYGVEWQVLNSKNFGVPQNRERVFIVGHLGGEGCGKVFPIEKDGGEVNELQGYVSNTLTQRYEGEQATGSYVGESELDAQSEPSQPSICQTGNQSDNPNGRGGQAYPAEIRIKNYGKLDDRTLESKEGLQESEGYLLSMQPNKENGDTPHRRGLAQQQTRESDGNLSRLPYENSQETTDVQSGGVQNNKSEIRLLRETQPKIQEIRRPIENENKSIYASLRIRRLTPIETERLQGFPDNWTSMGTNGAISDTQRYKMCGNAVTTNVVAEVVKRLYL